MRDSAAKTGLIAFILLLVFLPAWAQGAAGPASRSPWRISALRLEGFKSLPLKLVRAVLETKGPSGLLKPKRPLLDLAALARDRRRLQKLYQQRGFFKARVSSRLQRDPKTHSVKVIIRVREGPVTKVQLVRLTFARKSQRRRWHRKLRRLIKVRPGQRFSLERYQKSKKALARALAEDGHPRAKVSGRVLVYQATGRAVVHLRVDTGPRLRFGPVRVKGNRRISPRIVRREALFSPGQVFSRAKLEKTQRALYKTGFFSTVSITPDFRRTKNGRVPVTIKVRERKARSVKLGVGYGTEDELRVRVLFENRSLLGWGETISLEGKLSAIYQGLEATFKLPRFPRPEAVFLLKGGVRQSEFEAYEGRSRFFYPQVQYNLSPRWFWSLGYNLESSGVRKLIVQAQDPAFETQDFFISSFLLGTKYDSRDSVLDPRQGMLLRLNLEVALKPLGSELYFLRPVAEASRITPLWPQKKLYLALRAKGGLALGLESGERIPLIRRFFPGGSQSVRGYPFQRLGPLDRSGKPLGGEIALEGSAELRFPLWRELGGVVFLDAGNAWQAIDLVELASLRYAAGVGLRYHTPVGPLRLDWGYQLNPEDAPLPRSQFYLSVGQSF